MKLRKLKLLAMALSLFAACGGMLSAMETSENSKVNSKSGQNNNKTENNKPQSDSKSNENNGVQIPYYVWPLGYLGLNEVGDLFGFDYLLFGRYGIIKGAKRLLFGKKIESKKIESKKINNQVEIKVKKKNNKINNKVNDEVEKGPYWQHNYDTIMNTNTHWKYQDDYSNEQFEKTLERIMKWPNEKILLGQPYIEVRGNYIDLGNRVTGFSYENFLKNLRGRRKINWTRRGVCNVFEFTFDGIDGGFKLGFGGGFWNGSYDYHESSIVLGKSFGEFEADRVSMSFSAQPELYSW